jgi:hypothetical protein
VVIIKYKTLKPCAAQYGCAPFLTQTADIACDNLIRLRSNRVLYGSPPAYSGTGRPRGHGDKFKLNKFKLNDASTYWQANEDIEVEDARLGRWRLR